MNSYLKSSLFELYNGFLSSWKSFLNSRVGVDPGDWIRLSVFVEEKGYKSEDEVFEWLQKYIDGSFAAHKSQMDLNASTRRE